MDDTEKRRERRKQAAFERLGTNDPHCGNCPETDWRCMEIHHVVGKDFGDETVILCRNCHRKASDAQKDHPKQMWDRDPLERMAHCMLGLADLLEFAVTKLREFASYLIEQVRKDEPRGAES